MVSTKRWTKKSFRKYKKRRHKAIKTHKKQFRKKYRSLKKKLKSKKKINKFLKKENKLRKVYNLEKSPIIGILTLPMTYGKYDHAHSYLAQSYVKWIEMCGGRVVPIQYDLEAPVLLSLLSQCNGFLMTGGQVDNHMISREYHDFMTAVKTSFNYIRGENLRGNYYPIFAICLGFQILGMLSKDPNMTSITQRYENHTGISYTYARNYTARNIFQKGNFRLSKIFTKKEKEWQAKNPSVVENHGLGFFPHTDYMKTYKKQWDIVSLAPEKHPKKRKYINMFEFKHYPFYGTQFHPEKAIFEWRGKGISHEYRVRNISTKLGDFFIDECRKNKNKLLNKSYLIYNYTLYSRLLAMKILKPKKHILKKNNSIFDASYYFNISARDV